MLIDGTIVADGYEILPIYVSRFTPVGVAVGLIAVEYTPAARIATSPTARLSLHLVILHGLSTVPTPAPVGDTYLVAAPVTEAEKRTRRVTIIAIKFFI
jgi:hypothetical protein